MDTPKGVSSVIGILATTFLSIDFFGFLLFWADPSYFSITRVDELLKTFFDTFNSNIFLGLCVIWSLWVSYGYREGYDGIAKRMFYSAYIVFALFTYLYWIFPIFRVIAA